MKNSIKKFTITVILITVISLAVNGQTNVSGGIYTNTTWTLTNSPYIVVDTVVVFPNVILTIEPGVVVKFNNNKQIEVRQSRIIAEGTSTDSITFTSNAGSPTTGIYAGIYLKNSLYSKFNYCNFKYADQCIYPFYMYDTLTVKNSNFTYNNIGIGWVYYTALTVDSCLFKNNINGIMYATTYRAKVSNSSFINNQNGIFHLENVRVNDCLFNGNTGIAIGVSQGDTLYHCNIIGNDTGIVIIQGGMPYITKNIINNNNYGIILSNFISQIFCNSICNNTIFNVKYTRTPNTVMDNNYWCSNDSSFIASTIYDGYDNFSLGLIDFTPFDTNQCYLLTNQNNLSPNLKNFFKVYPNPCNEKLIVTLNGAIKPLHVIIKVIDLQGRIMTEQDVSLSLNQLKNNFELNVSNFSPGVYFIKAGDEMRMFVKE